MTRIYLLVEGQTEEAFVNELLVPHYARMGRFGSPYAQLDLTAPGARPLIEEVLRCPSCGGSAEFDDLPSTYMSFTT